MVSLAFNRHGSRMSRLDLALSRELRDGERVMWRGPKLARISARGFGLYIFAIPWTAFAVFWTAMASAGVGSIEGDGWESVLAWAFPMFGLPFVAVGVGMLSVPFMPLWESGKVLFAITNQRALKLRLGGTLDVQSCPAERIGYIERRERRDGTGSLRLSVSVGRDSDGDKTVEHFDIGDIADVFAANRALEFLAPTPVSSSTSTPIAAPGTHRPQSLR